MPIIWHINTGKYKKVEEESGKWISNRQLRKEKASGRLNRTLCRRIY
jgi:hypothetical protein